MWQHLREESLRAFEGPYQRLGIEFDHITGFKLEQFAHLHIGAPENRLNVDRNVVHRLKFSRGFLSVVVLEIGWFFGNPLRVLRIFGLILVLREIRQIDTFGRFFVTH